MRSFLSNPTRLTIAIGALVVGFAGMLAVWKGPHLGFYFSELNKPTSSVRSQFLAVEQEAPPDLREVEFGGQRFRVPPEMLQTTIADARMRGVLLRSDMKNMIVALPEARKPESALSEPPPPGVPADPVLRAAFVYRASSADFAWTMSWNELTRLKWAILAKQSPKYLLPANSRVFTRVEDNWSGMLTLAHVLERRLATFEWQSEVARGELIFPEVKTDDIEWIKSICATFEPGNEVFPEEVDDDDLHVIMDER